MESEKLSITVGPCSKCKERNGILQIEGNIFHVLCMACGARTSRYMYQKVAFEEWNKGNVMTPEEIKRDIIKKEVKSYLISAWRNMGLSTPRIHDTLVQYMVSDIEDTSEGDLDSEDLAMAMGRFLAIVHEHIEELCLPGLQEEK